MKIKSLKLVFQLFWSKYQTTDFKQIRKRFLKQLRTNLTVLGILIAGASIVLFTSTNVLGKTIAEDYFYSVLINDNGQKYKTLTEATTVGDLLGDLNIELASTDIVRPATNALIKKDNFEIHIAPKYLVKVIDGDQELEDFTTDDEPTVIVEDLGFELGTDDVVAWRNNPAEAPASSLAVLEIQRANDYRLNIDGHISFQRAQATSVVNILEELGHETEDIAYIRPKLNQTVKNNNSIIVYYERSDQEIIIETITTSEDNQLIENEVVYQVILDPQTGEELERHAIEEHLISKTAIKDSQIQQFDAPVISNSHRIGDLSEQQKDWLIQAGVPQADWFYVDYIIFRESRWRHQVWNTAGSGAYGLCQSLPASKMSSFGADYMDNPITQLRWCNWYALDRYGGWANAYQAWLNQHWW